MGILGAIEIDPGAKRSTPMLAKAAWDEGLGLRPIANSFAMSPPLTIDEEHIGKIHDILTRVLA